MPLTCCVVTVPLLPVRRFLRLSDLTNQGRKRGESNNYQLGALLPLCFGKEEDRSLERGSACHYLKKTKLVGYVR